jgi:hypothetical protein
MNNHPGFLLTAGDNYYPRSGDGNWQGVFRTKEEAEKEGMELLKENWHTASYDWYEIIDLSEWVINNDCD